MPNETYVNLLLVITCEVRSMQRSLKRYSTHSEVLLTATLHCLVIPYISIIGLAVDRLKAKTLVSIMTGTSQYRDLGPPASMQDLQTAEAGVLMGAGLGRVR